MLRGGGPLMELVGTDPKFAVPALAAQSKKLLDAMRVRRKVVEVPAGEIAAVLFVQTVLKDPPDPMVSADRHEPLFLLANPSVATALGAKDTGAAFRRLVVGWAESRPATETMSALYFTLLTHRRPFPEADPALIRLATGHKSAQIRWVAMEALGKSGTREATDKLTELLSDTSTLYDDVGGKDIPQQVARLCPGRPGQGKGEGSDHLRVDQLSRLHLLVRRGRRRGHPAPVRLQVGGRPRRRVQEVARRGGAQK